MDVLISGKFPKIARLKAEYFEWITDPSSFVNQLVKAGGRADLFTFLLGIPDRHKNYEYHLDRESISVLPITTYEDWWSRKINDKTRNMVRRAQKKGVEIRIAELDDAFVQGIKDIYDELPLRQGKPFKHYGKDIETLRKDHISYLERSVFIGAFYQNELIGFIKLVRGKGVASIMQIIAKYKHRDKAPTNALIAKAVEICAQEQVPFLQYGMWSKRSLGAFKKHHAFERLDLPRYFVPLTLKGRLLLALKMHRRMREYLPESWQNSLTNLRTRWNVFKYRSKIA